MFSPRVFAHLFFTITGCLSSGLVWAAAMPADLMMLPWPQILLGGALSLWGGLTRTAERALEASKAGRATDGASLQEFNLWHELGRDVLVSSGIGFIVCLVGMGMEWGVWVLGTALWLAGYLGTRFLSAAGDAALAALARKTGTM